MTNPQLPDNLRTPAHWFNPAAFTTAPQFTLGNASRNPVIGPAYRTLDVMLAKTFPVRENLKLELRAEAFNVTNSFRAMFANSGLSATASPGTALNSNTFGQIRTSGDPRIMQFAAKFVF